MYSLVLDYHIHCTFDSRIPIGDENGRTPRETYCKYETILLLEFFRSGLISVMYCKQGLNTKDEDIRAAPTLCASDGKSYHQNFSEYNSKYGFFGPKSYFTAACKNPSIHVFKTGYCKKGGMAVC